MERKPKKSDEVSLKVRELQHQVDELKELVNTLLSVIVEDPDGIHSGDAPLPPMANLAHVCM